MNRYSFSTGALFPLESEDALRLIKDAGFDRAELMPQSLSDASEASTLKFERTGIRLGSIHYPLAFFAMLYTAHRTMRDDGRRYLEDLLKMGTRLGMEVLVIHPHYPVWEGYEALLEAPVIENLRYTYDRCEHYGVTLAMENHPDTAPTPQALKRYIESLELPNLRPIVDVTEAKEAGYDPVAFLREIKPAALHLSDYKDGVKHLPAGEGDFDWQGIKAALDAHGYDGLYTLEPRYRFYLENIPEKLAKAYDFIRNLFPDAEDKA